MAWTVGKTLLGLGGPSTELTAASERRAQYQLGVMMRTQLTNYEQVMGKSDPHGWHMSLMTLRNMANGLEEGKWPMGSNGLNWFWSVPWGEGYADRDLWHFWAKADPSGGSSGDDADVVPLVPRGGLKRELVA